MTRTKVKPVMPTYKALRVGRFRTEQLSPDTSRRLVGVDTVTAQMPVLEYIGGVNGEPMWRLWTAHDLPMEHGTFLNLYSDGSINCMTVDAYQVRCHVVVPKPKRRRK